MKFLVAFIVTVALAASSVMAQTTDPIDYLISELEEELGDYSPSSLDDYYSYSYSYPDYYDYYSYYDEVTTPKPFKQQFLSLLFNKKAG